MFKTYPLSISPDYCADWDHYDAIREILQNALDSEGGTSIKFDGDSLIIMNEGVKLSPSTLLLGVSSKSDEDNSVGGFGEGYKIACLILKREGYGVEIHNSDLLWEPVWEESSLYDTRVLTIHEKPLERDTGALTFIINGLTQEDIEVLKERCLYLRESLGEVLVTDHGRILLEEEGRLYVGGLFVSKTGMKYSYDFHPSILKLNRDRKCVCDWDLGEATANIWLRTNKPETIAEMLFEDIKDVEKFEHSWLVSCEDVRTEAAKIWKREYKAKPLASDSDEQDIMCKEGYNEVKVTGKKAFTSVVKSSTIYKEYEHDKQIVISAKEFINSKINDYLETKDDKFLLDIICEIDNRGVSWND